MLVRLALLIVLYVTLTLLFSLAQSPHRATSPSPESLLRAARDPAYRAAMQAAQQKRFRAALKSFESIAANHPDPEASTLARYQIGYCYLTLQQKQHALAAFQNPMAAMSPSARAADACTPSCAMPTAVTPTRPACLRRW